MKIFYANIIYRGRSLDVKFCTKTIKEAAQILDCSVHYITNYVHYRKIDEPFTEILAKPYGSKSVEILEANKEYDFAEAKKLIDAHCDKEWSEHMKSINNSE